MTVAAFLLTGATVWGVIGGLVAVPFLLFGMDRIDHDADGAYVFRPLLIPGVLLIWPLVLWRWWVLAQGRDAWPARHRPRRDHHRWFAYAMPVAIIAVIGAGLSVRQSWPDHLTPERLSAATEVSE